MKRNLATEGRWRLRKPTDVTTGYSKYIAVYLDEILTPDEFRIKYCPEWSVKNVLYCRSRGYVPAETIVRYNSKHRPIHCPDVEYTYQDLAKEIPSRSSNKERIAKAKRERKANKNLIQRKLIL